MTDNADALQELSDARREVTLPTSVATANVRGATGDPEVPEKPKATRKSRAKSDSEDDTSGDA